MSSASDDRTLARAIHLWLPDRRLRLILGLLLAGIVVLTVALAVAAELDAKPGTTADWIAAISTFAALLAATYAGVQTSRILQLEQDRDRQRDDAIRQQQAAQVAVWGSHIEYRGPRRSHTFRPGFPDEFTVDPGPVHPVSLPVTIKNASPLPVFQFHVELYAVDPRDNSSILAGTYRHPTVIVGEILNVETITPDVVQTVIPVLDALPGTADRPSDFRLGWTFEDIAGVRWRRHPDGFLTEIPKPQT